MVSEVTGVVGNLVPDGQTAGNGRVYSACGINKLMPGPSVSVPMNLADERPVPGVKDQHGKARFSLIPFRALREVTNVLNYGATTKYSPNNWRKVVDKAAYVDAIVRHWTAYFQEGEEKDPESGLSALAHLACDVLFLLDDRLDKKDVPFEEYVTKLLTYSDFVKGQITEPNLSGVRKG